MIRGWCRTSLCKCISLIVIRKGWLYSWNKYPRNQSWTMQVCPLVSQQPQGFNWITSSIPDDNTPSTAQPGWLKALFPVQIQDFSRILWNPSPNFPVTIYKGTLPHVFLIEATQPPSWQSRCAMHGAKSGFSPQRKLIYRKKHVREPWVGFQLGYRK